MDPNDSKKCFMLSDIEVHLIYQRDLLDLSVGEGSYFGQLLLG